MPGLLRDTLKHLGGQGGALLQKQAYILSLFRLREIIERENALHLFRLLPTFFLSLYLR